MAIKNNLQQLCQAYEKLTQANEAFSKKDSAVESFRNLIDQRSLIMEDIDLISNMLVKEINHIYREHSFSCNTVPEAIRALQVLAPELSDQCEMLKKSLKMLVESDAGVTEQISGMKDTVKAEINKIRKSSRALKKYRQADPIGSCFINKIK